MPYILGFEEVGRSEFSQVGGKNASLGELLKAGIRVPPGFAVTTEAYLRFIEETKIKDEIFDLCSKVDPEDFASVERTVEKIRSLLLETKVPKEIEKAIKEAYLTFCKKCGIGDMAVAVRSSATAEDMPEASFAGQQDTYLWVRGVDKVFEKVKACWASLFSPRAIFYRRRMNFPHERVLISVGVQKMVNAKCAGVMFTLNPTNGDPSRVVIEANWGLGETVVSGLVTPDRFVVDKVLFEITERVISRKTVECVPHEGEGIVHLHISPERQDSACIEDREIVELVKLAKRIEEYYGSAQDIEWAIDKDIPFPQNIFILQSRPETVWSQKKKDPLLGKKSGYELLMEKAMQIIRIS